MPAAEAPIVDEFYWDRVFAVGKWHGPERVAPRASTPCAQRWEHSSSTGETTRDFQALPTGSTAFDCRVQRRGARLAQ